MREIKFRAWVEDYEDSSLSIMLQMPMNLLRFDYEDGWVIAFTDYEEFYQHECYKERKPNNFILMQYTGECKECGTETDLINGICMDCSLKEK